jgi:hypothetical protein
MFVYTKGQATWHLVESTKVEGKPFKFEVLKYYVLISRRSLVGCDVSHELRARYMYHLPVKYI